MFEDAVCGQEEERLKKHVSGSLNMNLICLKWEIRSGGALCCGFGLADFWDGDDLYFVRRWRVLMLEGFDDFDIGSRKRSVNGGRLRCGDQ
jgi:hypothetical protein